MTCGAPQAMKMGVEGDLRMAKEAAEKNLSMALRFSSEGFALALRSRGTAPTKNSPGCAHACEDCLQNIFSLPTFKPQRLYLVVALVMS